jgi:hypothetical protein
MIYNVPLWDWNVDYRFDYRDYARNAYHEKKAHILDLLNHTRLIENFFFLDIRDNYSRTSLNVARDYTQESYFVNQTDRNILSVNPYFLWRLTSQMTMTTGYTYSDTWYKNPTAIDQKDHIGYVDVRQELSLRSSMIAGVKHTENDNVLQKYRQDDLYGGYQYEYANNSILTLKAGNSWFDFNKTGRASQVFWDVNFTHHYSTMTVSYDTGLRYIPDPTQVLRREDRYLATVKKDADRTHLSVIGGLTEYRGAQNKHLETTSYRLTGSISHEITTKSKVIFDLTEEWLRDYLVYVNTNRYLAGARFEHLAAENLTLSLDYRYTNVYSPDVYLLNYYNNRFTVELKKVF